MPDHGTILLHATNYIEHEIVYIQATQVKAETKFKRLLNSLEAT